MNRSQERNTEHLDRKHLKSVNTGVQIGRAVNTAEATALVSLCRIRQLMANIKGRLVDQSKNSRPDRAQ